MDSTECIGRAAVYIENHLYEPISAGDVSAAVSYSYYHFHRCFQAVMGETIGSYIRSRRLTQAAWELVHTDHKILDIGLSLYFETAESFTRAFKSRYRMTPTQYRKNGKDVLIGYRTPACADERAFLMHPGLTPEIVSVPEVTVMGLRFETTAEGENCEAAWKEFHRIREAAGNPDLLCGRKYCIFEPEESCSSGGFSVSTKATALAGAEVLEGAPVLPGMQKRRLGGGTYARFIHRGPVAAIRQTYHYIWGVWFPKSGFELDTREDFEVYTGRFLGAAQEDSEIEIYFPIR